MREAFGRVAAAFQMSWQVHDAATPTRTLLLVSRFGHCLNDLLFRASIGALNVEIPAVVSNHRDFEGLAAAHGVPFHHLPVTPETKAEAEARLLELVDELDIDLVVLARYMQVLSDDLCTSSRAGPSTSTTRSCRASRAPGPTTRRTPGGSS